jgi:hypothetical protein
VAEEIKIDWTRFNEALVRRVATSQRERPQILVEQARGIFSKVAMITPSAKVGSIAADIRRVYGTPRGAYDALKREGGGMEKPFWKAVKAGHINTASDILQSRTGKPLYDFDGGVAHRRAKNRRGKVKQRAPFFFIRDEESLKAYIKEMQTHKDWLRSGWGATARKLGGSYVEGVLKHASAPGSANVDIGTDRISVTGENGVEYASIVDLERQLKWAIEAQAGAMERQWVAFEEKMNRLAGL